MLQKVILDIKKKVRTEEAEADRLREELAHLRHYKTVEEMYYDERGQATVDEILRQAKPARNQKPGRSRNNSRGMGR